MEGLDEIWGGDWMGLGGGGGREGLDGIGGGGGGRSSPEFVIYYFGKWTINTLMKYIFDFYLK